MRKEIFCIQNYFRLKIAIFVFMLSHLLSFLQAQTPLKEGTKAPDFVLTDHEGKLHRLKDYQGKWVVLYFYPKDMTPGCTKEACNFRDYYKDFQELQAVILGISTDNPRSHKQFKEKYRLPFTLLADTAKQVCKQYGVLSPLGFAQRITFIINPEGEIVKVFTKVNPAVHAEEVKAFLLEQQKQ